MIKLHKLIASVLGIGYIGKGGGTVAAAVCCIIWWLLVFVGNFSNFEQVLLITVVLIFGIWSGNVVDEFWGKDSNKVVIDEVAGMIITLLFIPAQPKFILTGFVLFRFFDITKPLLIKKLESLPKGWGVMADDILAGIYAHILLYLIVLYKLF